MTYLIEYLKQQIIESEVSTMYDLNQNHISFRKIIQSVDNGFNFDTYNFENLEYNNINDIDNREYKSNVYDIENGDNFEDYAKEFYDYYKECFEDLYEDN